MGRYSTYLLPARYAFGPRAGLFVSWGLDLAGGGNNDAAALWHGANEALASRRQARLLVMVSDGLPTECTTTALRTLVRRLEKRRIVCAQFAVAPIPVVCFPHHVVLDPACPEASVKAFGMTVSRLVRRAMSLG